MPMTPNDSRVIGDLCEINLLSIYFRNAARLGFDCKLHAV